MIILIGTVNKDYHLCERIVSNKAIETRETPDYLPPGEIVHVECINQTSCSAWTSPALHFKQCINRKNASAYSEAVSFLNAKIAVLCFKMFPVEYNDFLHTLQQCHCREVCKMSLWLIYHEHEHEKVSLNFELYWNIVCGTGATSVIKGDTGDQGTSDYPHRLTSYSCSSCVACDMHVVWQGACDMRPVHDVLCLPCVVGAWHEGILHFHGCSVRTMCDMHTVHGNGCVTCVQCMTYVQCVICV